MPIIRRRSQSAHSRALRFDKTTRTIYLPFGAAANRVAVVNAATCDANNTSGCAQSPAVVKVGKGTFVLALSAATDTIYGPNNGLSFDGERSR